MQPVGPASNATQPTWLRCIFVAMSVLMTVVVAASVASSFWGARELANTVVQGQAALLEHSARQTLPRGPLQPSAADLEALVQADASLGLRYAALLGPRGEQLAAGGQASAEFAGDPPPSEPGVEHRGDVVRSTAPLPRGPGGPHAAPGRGGPPDPFDPPHAGDAGPPSAPGRFGPPPRLLLEFEPTMVAAVTQRAQRDFAVGLLACVVLWGAAGLFWRLATRAARTEATLASQRQLTALGEMSAIVAHELRNPLASLKGHAQLLCDQATDPRVLKKARRVLDEAVRLQQLSSGLLEFVRSGRVELTGVEVAALAKEAAHASTATVKLELADAPAEWKLDRARIRQVLVNLLDNAHDAAPGEPVRMTLLERNGSLEIAVHDRGPGIPPDERERIFAPFVTRKTKGTGLGLAVARRIVELHGGTITCEDHPDGGGVFRVALPHQD